MRRNNFAKQIFKQIDWILLGLVIVILIVGVLSVLSTVNAGYDPDELTFWEYVDTLDLSAASLQLVFFAVGLLALVLLLFVDYNNLREYTDIIYWLTVALLVAVKFFGSEVNGTAGWFKIGSRGFQPAEFGKVFMIVVLAKEFAKRTEGKKDGIRTFRELFPMLWRFAIAFALIVWQPDFGTAMVYAVIFIGMMFVAKTSFKLIGILFGVVAVASPGVYFLLADYQKKRLISFINPALDPDAALQVTRAKEVASSGGMTGKGLFSNELLTQGTGYLPYAETDFIFASTTEAIGCLGAALVVLLYLAFIIRMFMLATRAKDDFGAYLIVGVACMFLFHVIENIGMNIGMLPVTGIPLPFFSYGGSNMLSCMLALSLVLNVNLRRLKYTSLQGT